jgi:hypothetical protein
MKFASFSMAKTKRNLRDYTCWKIVDESLNRRRGPQRLARLVSQPQNHYRTDQK